MPRSSEKRLKDLTVSGLLAAVMGLSGFAQGQPSANSGDKTLVIGGRAEAPVIDTEQLPLPGLPGAKPLQTYGPLDPADLILLPELLLIDHQRSFGVNLGKLADEVSSASKTQPGSRLSEASEKNSLP